MLKWFVCALPFFGPFAMGASVLVMGDSEGLEGFSHFLAVRLRADGNSVNSYTLCGSNPFTWLRGYTWGCANNGAAEHEIETDSPNAPQWPSVYSYQWRTYGAPVFTMANLINRINPEVVIMQTGDNMINDVQLHAKYVRGLKRVLDESNVHACVWLAPPYGPDHVNSRAIMTADTASILGQSCKVFDSVTATWGLPGFGSGHWKTKGPAAAWLERAYPTIRNAIDSVGSR